jgi:argininosuccinate synthase
MSTPKIVVAYSGGLDTSVMVRWLMDRWNAEIITATGDLGQKKELLGVREKALATGATKAFVVDARQEFLEKFAFPALKAGALYERAYPMATAIGRPLLARILVDIARQEGATMVAHGCTGKGNDQVRFEVSVAALAPDLRVLAPLREWEFRSREEEIEYARANGIQVAATVKSPYSIDENLWGIAIECGVLEDPEVEAPEDAFQITTSPEQAPDTPASVEIEFERGVPIALDGKLLDPVALVSALNDLGGAHGIGRLDLIENRLVGIKSREVYEAPAATILHFAHTELERLTLEKSVMHMKSQLAAEYAALIYNGLWFSPLRNALDAFVDETQRTASGTIRVKLFKGNVGVQARKSIFSLYNANLATYTAQDTFDHKASAGFIGIYGLPVRTYNEVQRSVLRDMESPVASGAAVEAR